MTSLPGLSSPESASEVLAGLASLRASDLPHAGGRLFAYVFEHGSPELSSLQLEAFAAFSAVNALDPTAFPSVATMENSVVGAMLDLFGGPSAAVGTFTSGGTESCLLAVKSARDLRPADSSPRLLLAESAHPAFWKAAAWLGLSVDVVPVSGSSLVPSPTAFAAALTPDTVLAVASAVSYPHGVLDPVPELAAACAAAGVPLHVDACIGGFALAARRALGDDVPPFDLAVPGVASLSVDLHKYGYALKPASVLLFDSRERRRASWFGHARWAGYPLVNSTVQSTKSAGPLAAAWATLRYLGSSGLLSLLSRQLTSTRALLSAVSDLEGLRVLGSPAASLVALASALSPTGEPVLDIGAVHDGLRARGWHLQPQLAYGAAPPSLHLTVDASSDIPGLVRDLVPVTAAALAAGPPSLPPELLELAGGLTVSSLTPEVFGQLLAAAGLDTGPIEIDARVNALLQALSPDVRTAVITLVADALFTPTRT